MAQAAKQASVDKARAVADEPALRSAPPDVPEARTRNRWIDPWPDRTAHAVELCLVPEAVGPAGHE